MNQDELLELIPFYVANTLDSQENEMIDRELQKSPELREAVTLWKRTRHAVIAENMYEKEGHPSVDELLSYAGNEFQNDPVRLRAIENHFIACDDCKNEARVLGATFTTKSEMAHTFIERMEKKLEQYTDTIIDFVRPLKPAYAIPALAAVAICIIVVVTMLKAPAFELTREAIGRGERNQEFPTLSVSNPNRAIEFKVYITPSGIPSMRYSLTLISPSGEKTPLPEYYTPEPYDTDNELLKVSVEGTYLKIAGGYGLDITEVPPASTQNIVPSTYHYLFNVTVPSK